MKHLKFNISIVSLLALVICTYSFRAIGQDSLGWEIYDSIEVKLESGLFTQRYLPFDVPFYLYGDNTNIESIQLQIIDESFQSCCLGELGLRQPEKKNSTACDCECQSLSDQRLQFFLTVRRIHNNEDSILTKILHDLELEKIRIDSFLATTKKFALKRSKNTQKSEQNIDSTFLLEHWKEILRDPMGDYLKQFDSLSMKISDFYLGGLGLHVVLEDSIRRVNDELLYLLRFKLKYKANYIDSLRLRAKRMSDLAYYNRFKEKYKQDIDRWNNYVHLMDHKIATDSLKQCRDCDFDPKKCNTICSWTRDNIIGNGHHFFLAVPPLDPNKGYRFFFTIQRTANTNETESIKQAVRRKIISNIDSVTNEYIDIMMIMGLSVDVIRKEILSNRDFINTNIVSTIIHDFLKQKFLSDEGLSTTVKLLRIDDKYIYRRFLDAMITHKLYRGGIEDLYQWYGSNNIFNLLPISVNGRSLDDVKMAFFEANLMEKFSLLDTLNQIKNDDRLNRFLELNLPYRRIQRDIPSGLLPYKNLQRVSLRDLDEVNDFDLGTVEPYRLNLEKYARFLTRIQKFLNDLIKSEDNIRVRLFGSSNGSATSDLTPRSQQSSDRQIKDELLTLSSNIEKHQRDVARAINIYGNFKDNISEIDQQGRLLIDTMLYSNESIQLGVARKTGGISSANFQTRSEWYVTADAGVAYIPFGSSANSAVTPYFGANFNIRPINRQAHYGLFSNAARKRTLSYTTFQNQSRYFQGTFGNKLYKASSLVLGVTTTDMAVTNVRENLIDNGGANLNLLTGWGLRLTDAGRLGIGAIWTKKIDPNPTVPTTTIKPYFYVSLSFDIDVISVLGRVGELLTFN